MIEHSSPISGISTYRDLYVATAGYDNKLILWNALTHESIAVGFHDHLVNQCQFSPDGCYLLSSSSDHTVRLWSVPEMKLIGVMSSHEDDVEGIAFHPTQHLIATASRDRYVRIFNFEGQLLKTLKGHRQDVLSVIWGAEQELITSSDDGTVKCWDAANGQLIQEVDLRGVETDTVVITSSGLILAGNDEGEITIINSETKYVKAHRSGIKRLCYSSQHNSLISLSYDRQAILWKLIGNNLELTKKTTLPSIVWARSADFLGNDKIVFATFGSSYAVYDYLLDQWFLEHVKDTQGCNAILIDKKQLYTVGDAGILKRNGQDITKLPSLCNFLLKADETVLTGGQTGELFNTNNGSVIYQHYSPLNCGAIFYKENKLHIIIGTYRGEGLVFCKYQNDFQFVTTIKLHKNAIKGLACSENFIYSVCATGASAFHKINDFSVFKELPKAHHKIANGCIWIKDDLFGSVSRDLTLRLTSTMNQTITNTPHRHSIKCLAISYDKRLIATGDYRGSVAIYDRQADSWQIFRLTASGISSIAFDELNCTFKATSYDGNVYDVKLTDYSLCEAS